MQVLPNFCSYDNVLVDGYVANIFTVIFISVGLKYTGIDRNIFRKLPLARKIL